MSGCCGERGVGIAGKQPDSPLWGVLARPGGARKRQAEVPSRGALRLPARLGERVVEGCRARLELADDHQLRQAALLLHPGRVGDDRAAVHRVRGPAGAGRQRRRCGLVEGGTVGGASRRAFRGGGGGESQPRAHALDLGLPVVLLVLELLVRGCRGHVAALLVVQACAGVRARRGDAADQHSSNAPRPPREAGGWRGWPNSHMHKGRFQSQRRSAVRPDQPLGGKRGASEPWACS